MWSFAALCDEFYVNSRLYMKLELEPSRDGILHFFEQIRKGYPRMVRFRRRDDGASVLDEESGEGEPRRYVRLDTNALKFGCYGVSEESAVIRFAELVLDQAPHQLTFSDLDYDYLEVVLGFDLEYCGNHDELVAETLFPDHPVFAPLDHGPRRIIDCQPFFGFAIGENCEEQTFLEVKGRTSTYELRSGEFENAAMSVLVTVRRYWGFNSGASLVDAYGELLRTAATFAEERAVPYVVKPLASAIASRR